MVTRASRCVGVLAAASIAIGACTADPEVAPGGGTVTVAVAPLSLPGVSDACYTVTVSAGGQTVWTRSNICASGAGDGAGGVAYVGTCDASGTGENTVSITISDIFGPGGVPLPEGSYIDPTEAAALTRTVICLADRGVAADFDLTVMRMATQGFFDVAVTFEDIFCSAKLDCEEPDGDPIRLLANAQGVRSPTAVLALACTGGAGSDTVLHLSDVVITCPSRPDLVIDPTLGPGNLSAAPGAVVPNATLFEAAVYRGTEALGGYGKRYWNVALGLADVVGCSVTATATASDAAFVDGWTPPGTTWPYIAYAADLDTCERHALNGGDGVVTTAYTDLDGIQLTAQFSAAGVLSFSGWWHPAWHYQQVLEVAAGATALTADSTFTLVLDHAALVAAGQSLPSGDDLRLLHWNGSAWGELDRVALTAWNTSAVTLAFAPAAPLPANTSDGDYVLVWGNPAAGAPPADGRAIYWLWEDFADGDFTTGNVWTANFGAWSVVDGHARLVNPTGADTYEAGLYYPGGAAWTNYVVSMRIRDASTNPDSYMGPALRVANPAIGNTSLWWFEYQRGTTAATMRPYTSNTDHGWTYNVTLPTAFPSNVWVDVRYQVVGTRFWSWYGGTALHVGVTAAAPQVVAQGSIALSAHNSYGPPQDFHYDDVRVWKHLPDPPTLTLGAVTAR